MEFSALEDLVQNTPAGTVINAPVTVADPTAKVVKFYVFNNFNVDPAGQPRGRREPRWAGRSAGAATLHGLPRRVHSQSGRPGHRQGVGTPVFASPRRREARCPIPAVRSAQLQLRLRRIAADPFSRDQQEVAFKALNEMVKVAPPPDADPTSQVITALNTAWYPGNAPPQQRTPWWRCGTIRRDPKRAQHKGITWTRSATRAEPATSPTPTRFFASIGRRTSTPSSAPSRLRVCKEHVMPHARRTHDLFWTSIGPSQPARFRRMATASSLRLAGRGSFGV